MGFAVTILSCNRLQLLKLVVKSVLTHFPVQRTKIRLWIDHPKHQLPSRDHATNVRNYTQYLHRQHNVDVILFAKHMGTRTMWLTALSLLHPHLILEDDVVVLQGAPAYYLWSLRMLRKNLDILGSSFSAQTTVVVPGSDATLASTEPYTYPLVGSHGFMISPTARDSFLRHLQTRANCTLLIKNCVTTIWYKHFVKTRQIEDRMWTQEMVAFANQYNLTTLYPPTVSPLTLHCASAHARDLIATPCLKTRWANAAKAAKAAVVTERFYAERDAVRVKRRWDARIGPSFQLPTECGTRR